MSDSENFNRVKAGLEEVADIAAGRSQTARVYSPTITEEAVEAAPWNLIKRVPLPIGREVIVGKWFTRPDGYVIWDQEIYVAHDAGWRAEWGDDKPTHWIDAPPVPGAAAPLMFPVQGVGEEPLAWHWIDNGKPRVATYKPEPYEWVENVQPLYPRAPTPIADEVRAAVERVREMIAEMSHNDTVVMSPGIAESHARDLCTILAALNTEAGR